jgi:hypothetical protein
MPVAFPCTGCGHANTASNDSIGSAVACPQCGHSLTVPTPIWRAIEIVDRLEGLLVRQEYVPGTTFIRLSKIGASTRMEALHALYIVVAETFRAAHLRGMTPEVQHGFDNWASGTAGIAFRLGHSLVPDAKLGALAALYKPDDGTGGDESPEEKLRRFQRKLQFSQEEGRLLALAMNDAAWSKSEAMESFVAFLKTLNPTAADYWASVYRRIGLSWPVNVSSEGRAQPNSKQSWWRRLFRVSAGEA